MSDQQGIEDAVGRTINCASAKILTKLDSGASKADVRLVVLGELNGIRRYFSKLLRENAEGLLPEAQGESREGG